MQCYLQTQKCSVNICDHIGRRLCASSRKSGRLRGFVSSKSVREERAYFEEREYGTC